MEEIEALKRRFAIMNVSKTLLARISGVHYMTIYRLFSDDHNGQKDVRRTTIKALDDAITRLEKGFPELSE